MKKLKNEEMECRLAQFCANQDDYGYIINIDNLYPDPNKEWEERVKKNLFF